MEKMRLQEVVIVEGRYDAVALHSLVDALIITTDGFSIFNDGEKKDLIRRLGKERGLLVLTDSDAAGFRIRAYVEKICPQCVIKNAYIPAVEGKESRKSEPSKEGTLGVEGMPPDVLLQCLLRAEATANFAGTELITYADLYEMGLSGGRNSAVIRRHVLRRLGLPPRLSKRALCQVLSSLYTRGELEAVVDQTMLQRMRQTKNEGAGP